MLWLWSSLGQCTCQVTPQTNTWGPFQYENEASQTAWGKLEGVKRQTLERINKGNGQKPQLSIIFWPPQPKLGQHGPKSNHFWRLTQKIYTSRFEYTEWLLQMLVGNHHNWLFFYPPEGWNWVNAAQNWTISEDKPNDTYQVWNGLGD